MIAEFEEKEFEIPLIHQLAHGTFNLWSPGQVFEGKFGIDAAIDVQSQIFWANVGFSNIPRGAILEHHRLGRIRRNLRTNRTLPDFNLNLFLQIKRPEGLRKRPRALSRLGLQSPYWRFTITPHQQILLEKLNRDLSNRAFVAYACPVFHLHSDLYYHTRNNSLVEHSTFIKVSRLTGHTKWVYHRSGTTGIGCSEPKRINDENFITEFRNLLESMSNIESTLVQSEVNLKLLGDEIVNIINEESENPVAREILNRYKQIQDLKISLPAKNYILINAFCSLTNCTWLVAK